MAEPKEVEVIKGPAGEDFLNVLIQMGNGVVLHEFGAEMGNVVRAVKETGRKGSMTIKLLIEPISDSTDALTIEPIISVQIPKDKLGKSVFFPTDNGTLQRDNPKQMPLYQVGKGDK